MKRKHSQRPALILGSLALLCLLAAAFYAFSSHGFASAANTGRSHSVGHPAITPSGTGATPVSASDVRTYVLAHPFPSGATTTGKPLTIQSTDLITSAEAATRLKGEETGLADSALVYYVVVDGPFTTQFVSYPPGDTHPIPNPAYGVEVFDAQTGDLLLWWIPN